jgi:hypothetical protein
MADEQPTASQQNAGQKGCWPLPIALYDYSGLLFELYQGGQPPARHFISWSRLQPMPPASGEPDKHI